MLLATKEPGLPTKAHIYTMFHILLHPTQSTCAHKRSWNAEDVKKNAASLSYSQMDHSQHLSHKGLHANVFSLGYF
jgi:hypothetical protein